MNTIRFIVLRAVAILVLLLGIIHAARGTPDQHPHTIEKKTPLIKKCRCNKKCNKNCGKQRL